jgi:hypothetical protein
VESDWLPDLFAKEITAAADYNYIDYFTRLTSQIPMKELHCTDVSLRRLTDEDSPLLLSETDED